MLARGHGSNSLGPAVQKRPRAYIPQYDTSSLLCDTRIMFVLNLPAFENNKYTADERFHGSGLYGEILTKKEPIRTLRFTLPYNNGIY